MLGVGHQLKKGNVMCKVMRWDKRDQLERETKYHSFVTRVSQLKIWHF